jgi:hypothetical protein
LEEDWESRDSEEKRFTLETFLLDKEDFNGRLGRIHTLEKTILFMLE